MRMTTAMPAMQITQKTVTVAFGCGLPRWVSWELTSEAESAVVMKNTTSMTMTSGAIQLDPGKWSKTLKKMSSAAGMESIVPSGAISPSRRCSQMVVPPKMVKAAMMIAEGINSTPRTNWRMVRPREILATNTPTNGDQDTHHAQ